MRIAELEERIDDLEHNHQIELDELKNEFSELRDQITGLASVLKDLETFALPSGKKDLIIKQLKPFLPEEAIMFVNGVPYPDPEK